MMMHHRFWVLIYGIIIDNTEIPYCELCDELKQFIQDEVSKHFSNPYYIEVNSDSESYSVRFMIQAVAVKIYASSRLAN